MPSSLENTSRLASKIEEVFATAGGKEDATHKIRTIVWPALSHGFHTGPDDAFWKTVENTFLTAMRAESESYEHTEDWMERLSRVWLSITSARHLFIQLLGVQKNHPALYKPPMAVSNRPPELGDYPAGMQSLWGQESEERDRIASFVGLPDPIDFSGIQKKLQMNAKIGSTFKFDIGNLSLRLPRDYYHKIIGASDFSITKAKASSAPVTKETFDYSGHTLTLPITWKEELTPTRIIPSEEAKDPEGKKRQQYTRQSMFTLLVTDLMKEASARGIPLVARDNLTNLASAKRPRP